ncbi:MAG: VOC family protein [Alphaproteobacteria bacterium]|nr:VOC family protein [Alphaproteobacteria bacterium]
MAAHGSFHWNELNTRDADGAKTFYTHTIGWSFEGMPMESGGTYWVAKSGEQPAGGIFNMQGPQFEGVPEHWLAYIAVDDVDARLAKAVALGAAVLREPFDIPGVGRIAILRDALGAVIGLITPAS